MPQTSFATRKFSLDELPLDEPPPLTQAVETRNNWESQGMMEGEFEKSGGGVHSFLIRAMGWQGKLSNKLMGP